MKLSPEGQPQLRRLMNSSLNSHFCESPGYADHPEGPGLSLTLSQALTRPLKTQSRDRLNSPGKAYHRMVSLRQAIRCTHIAGKMSLTTVSLPIGRARA